MEDILKFAQWKDDNFNISSDKDKPYYPKITSKYFDTIKMSKFQQQNKYALEELLVLWTTQ